MLSKWCLHRCDNVTASANYLPGLAKNLFVWLIPTMTAMLLATCIIIVQQVFSAEVESRALFHILQVRNKRYVDLRNGPTRNRISSMSHRTSEADQQRPGAPMSAAELVWWFSNTECCSPTLNLFLGRTLTEDAISAIETKRLREHNKLKFDGTSSQGGKLS